MSRAGWTLGVTWLVTCLIGAWLSFNVLLTVLAVSVIACLTFLCVPALRCRTLLLVGAAISLSLLSLLLYETDHYLPVSRLEGMTVTLRARVCDTDGESVIRVMEGDLPAGTQLHFRNCSGDSMPDAYDIVSGTFTLYGCDGGD